MALNHIDLCDPQFWPQVHYLNKLVIGPLGDATHQISRFSPCDFLQDFIMFSLYKLCKT